MTNKTLHLKPSIEVVSRRDGLPTNQIHNIGYVANKLWLSTPNGLAVYDSESFTVLSQNTGLLTHGLRSLSVNEKFIYACSDRGIDIIDPNSFQSIESLATADLGFGWCQCAVTLLNGDLLLGCAKGLHIWNIQTNKVSSLPGSLSNELIKKLVISPDGIVLVQTENDELWSFDGKDINFFPIPEESKIQNIQSIYMSENEFWLIGEQKLSSLNFNLTLKENLNIYGLNSSIRRIIVISEVKLIVADHHHVFSVEKIGLNWRITETLCENIFVNDFCLDELANIWIATEFSGLIKLLALKETVKHYQSKKSNSILAIRPQENNESLLLAGTNASYEIIAGENKKQIKSLSNLTCWDIFKDNQGGIWSASNSGLVFTDYSQIKPDIYKNSEVGAGRCLLDMGELILYGSVSGLFMFSKLSKEFTPIYDDSGNTLSYVYSLIWKNKSTIFVTTLGRGAWVYNSQTKEIKHWKSEALLLNVYSIDQNSIGQYVVANDNSIILIDGSNSKSIYTSDDPVAAWVCLWYSDSEVVLGSSQGLKLININSGECHFKINSYPDDQFWEFTTSRSLVRLKDNSFWCGLNEGAVELKLTEMMELVQPPIPKFKNISCTAPFRRDGNRIDIQEGIWTIDIGIRSYWYWHEKSISYQYRLAGLLPNWREVGNKQISFVSLATGEYLLEIRVINNLAQSIHSSQLLLIAVHDAGYFAKLWLKSRNFIGSILTSILQVKDFWRLRSQFDNLEQLVNLRTQELSIANKKLKHMNESLTNLSQKDQLTGLYNRHALVDLFDDEIKRASRSQTEIGVLMIDIDYFKPYNDYYGHVGGDLCLQNVANCLGGCIHRAGDIIARFGGEEFVVVLPDTDLAHAESFAKLCVKAIEKLALPHESSKCAKHITISIGVATSMPEIIGDESSRADFRDALIHKADLQLYQAKESGRNKVC